MIGFAKVGKGKTMPKIFCKVKCNAYLKKESDGIRLECVKRIPYEFAGKSDYLEEPAQGNAWGMDEDISVKAVQAIYTNGEYESVLLKDLSDFEGSSVLKTYYQRREEPFTGWLVGYTNIITSANIGTSSSEAHFSDEMYGSADREWKHLTKDPHYTKVGVVYFKNNSKRYVLPEDIEYIEEGKTNGSGDNENHNTH